MLSSRAGKPSHPSDPAKAPISVQHMLVGGKPQEGLQQRGRDVSHCLPCAEKDIRLSLDVHDEASLHAISWLSVHQKIHLLQANPHVSTAH